MKFADPRSDIGFKKIFGDERHPAVLISFLNAVLDLPPERAVVTVELLNPYQAPRLAGFKETTLDIRATDQRGITFIVEMQVQKSSAFAKRALYYTSKAYVSQLAAGQDYPVLNQVIFIGIMDFELFDSRHYLSRHLILNQETLKQEWVDHEYNFIELPKFVKTEAELETLLDRWVYFIKHARDLRMIPAAGQEPPPLREAYEIANQQAWTPEELDVYEYWTFKEWERIGAMELATREAEARAREAEAQMREAEARAQEAETRTREIEARAQEAETRTREIEARAREIEARAQEAETRAREIEARAQEAEIQSREAERLRMARAMVATGADVALVAQVTGLSEAAVRGLREADDSGRVANDRS